MGITSSERSALGELAPARLRGAKPDELLELAEAAIHQANAVGDSLTLVSVAAELDAAAPAHPDQAGGLRLRLAAARARAIAARRPAITASAEVPVPLAAKVAFWATVMIAALALFLFGAMATSDSYGIAYLLMFVVVLGSLFVAVAGIVGFVQSNRAGSRRGVLMSAVPCLTVCLLIVVRIAVSLF
jgi:hypothetical protein